jgi:hypothetical protein
MMQAMVSIIAIYVVRVCATLRVGQNRICTPYMYIYGRMYASLKNAVYTCTYMVMAVPSYAACLFWALQQPSTLYYTIGTSDGKCCAVRLCCKCSMMLQPFGKPVQAFMIKKEETLNRRNVGRHDIWGGWGPLKINWYGPCSYNSQLHRATSIVISNKQYIEHEYIEHEYTLSTLSMSTLSKGGWIGCLILPAKLDELQQGSTLAGEAQIGALRIENHFLKSARIEPKFFCCSHIYIYIYKRYIYQRWDRVDIMGMWVRKI